MALCFGVATLVQADVKAVAETGFILENRVQVNADPDVVWRALVDQVDDWWPKDHSWWGEQTRFRIDAHAGGCFCESHGDRSAEHMRVSLVEPGKLLRMTGGLGPLQGMGLHGALDWRLVARDQGTEIVLTYRVSGFHPEGFEQLAPVVDRVQSLQLEGLARHLGP